MASSPDFVFTFLNGKVLAAAAPDIARGFVLTVWVSALVVVAGLAAGFALALLRLRRWRPLNALILFAVDLLRAVPPLVVIVLLFFGLPSVGLELSGFQATFITLSAILAAFAEEIFYASILAVSPGQAEAARSLGLRPVRVMRLVVLPQAMRIALPPLTNRTIAIVKNTALGSVVGLADILGAAQSSLNFTGNPSPLILGAAAYLVLFAPFILLARRVERRLGTH